jgi:hypothetical protein
MRRTQFALIVARLQHLKVERVKNRLILRPNAGSGEGITACLARLPRNRSRRNFGRRSRSICGGDRHRGLVRQQNRAASTDHLICSRNRGECGTADSATLFVPKNTSGVPARHVAFSAEHFASRFLVIPTRRRQRKQDTRPSQCSINVRRGPDCLNRRRPRRYDRGAGVALVKI